MNSETVFQNVSTESEPFTPFLKIGEYLRKQNNMMPLQKEAPDETADETQEEAPIQPVLQRQITSVKYERALQRDNPDAVYREHLQEYWLPGYVEDTTLFDSETDIPLWVADHYSYACNKKTVFEITRHSQRQITRYEKIDNTKEFYKNIDPMEHGGVLSSSTW